MKICKHEWEYAYTLDRALPYGEIESIAIFKCKICGEEIDEYDNDRRIELTNRLWCTMH